MGAVTVYGVVVLVFMMAMYALEGRHRGFTAAFALGCALSSSYGFISGTWPFGVVEAVWCLVALRRYLGARRAPRALPPPGRPGIFAP
jgi:membrane-bound metal-dependent hydrolase YbcI (DUF457 family)